MSCNRASVHSCNNLGLTNKSLSFLIPRAIVRALSRALSRANSLAHTRALDLPRRALSRARFPISQETWRSWAIKDGQTPPR